MIALAGGLIIDGTGSEILADGIVVIDDSGIIAACGSSRNVKVPDGAEVVDCKGKTVMPGLIDAHVHLCLEPCADPISVLINESDARTAFKAANNARKTLQCGVTTARDMGGKNYIDLDLRDAVAGGELTGPELLVSGKVITMTGGHGWQMGEEVDGEDEARRGARKQLKRGVDLVKVMATGGVMTEGVEPGSPQLTGAEMRAAIEEAHRAGRKTATHAQGTTGIKNAIRAGIDSIEHGIFLDEEAVEMMLKRGVYLVPTLAAPYWISRKGREAGIPEYAVKKSDAVVGAHVNSFKLAYEAGVKIAMGTDAGTPFNDHGKNSFEILLMVKNGMSAPDAIRASTSRGAELLGISDRVGTVTEGKQADLLVLDGNPLIAIGNIEKVHMIFKNGRLVKQ